MDEPNPQITNPKMLAELGEKIYRERYQHDYEQQHAGKFVAIDVKTGDAYLGDTPEEAFQLARREAPGGLFHLIRIGFSGVFRAGQVSANTDWVFR